MESVIFKFTMLHKGIYRKKALSNFSKNIEKDEKHIEINKRCCKKKIIFKQFQKITVLGKSGKCRYCDVAQECGTDKSVLYEWKKQEKKL